MTIMILASPWSCARETTSTARAELLAIHELQRKAHLEENTRLLVSMFADNFANVERGRITRPSREESQARFQAYFDRLSIVAWEDIAPPVIRVSDDESMAYVLVHKRVRYRSKGNEAEVSTEFAWLETYEMQDGEWRLTTAVSTRRPAEKAPARRIAVTFDDLPGTTPGNEPCDATSLLARNRRLLAHLAEYEVPAVGFVNEGHACRAGGALEKTLSLWLKASHTLGNHTYSHLDINHVTLDAYIADIERGERMTQRLLAARGERLHYFRHPFLHTGADTAKRRDLRRYLDANGYVVAPVTIDSQEWIFAAVYHQAKRRGDRETMHRVADAYVPYLENVGAYFESRSSEVVGYEPSQILLLHANELNADHFHRVAEMLQARSYEFISLNEALADPAYELTDGYIGPLGLSWIHRWALAKGMEIDNKEPREPAWLAKLFETSP